MLERTRLFFEENVMRGKNAIFIEYCTYDRCLFYVITTPRDGEYSSCYHCQEGARRAGSASYATD